jgi:multidrug efflux pump subunit AcrA (membrane-fusion protein)
MRVLLLFVALSPFTVIAAANGPADPVLEPCWVKVKDEVEIPAQKEGVLTEMGVVEGSPVKAGSKIAVIDDREARAAVSVAEFALQAADKRASDDIEARFAAKSADVAKVDWERDLEANRRAPGAVPDIEVQQKKLMYEKSTLQMEKAENDQVLAALDAKVKKAERDAAQVALEKRTIYAPFDGEVVKLHREKSEWVNPGDPILTLMRFDKLYGEVFVNVSQYDREELLGKKVTITVPRARGKETSLQGKIVHVSQMIESGGSFLVRAEVLNTREGNSWVIQPSASPRGKMTIHLQ